MEGSAVAVVVAGVVERSKGGEGRRGRTERRRRKEWICSRMEILYFDVTRVAQTQTPAAERCDHVGNARAG